MRPAPLIAALVLALAAPAAAEVDVTSRSTIFPGPYLAELVDVIDGDTLDMRIAIWPGLVAEYAVRVRGIDTPETRRPGCEEERDAGEAAALAVRDLYGPETRIRLSEVAYDPFSGRVVAEVRRYHADRWLSLADELVERELAQRWRPGMNPVPWCLLLSAGGPRG